MDIAFTTDLAYWSALVLPGISMLLICMFDVKRWTSVAELGRSLLASSFLQTVLCLVLFLSIAEAKLTHHLALPLMNIVLLMGIGSILGFCTIYAIVHKRLQL